jgi:hypothetical protein
MMEKTKQDICDLAEFDDTVSLWQLIPAGKGKALSLLRTIVDSIHNSDNPKLPSILIIGDEGKRTYANAFFRALGVKQINEIHASLLLPGSGLAQFFSSEYNVAHLIAYVELLVPTVDLSICQILKSNEYHIYNFLKEEEDTFNMPGLVVLTARNLSEVVDPIIETVDYIVLIEKYTHLDLVLLQRLRYIGVDYECEDVLQKVLKVGKGQLKYMINFLQVCISVMMADGRNRLLLKDIEKAERIW